MSENRLDKHMTRRNLREQVFYLLFRVEFNSAEDMPEQLRLFFEDADKEFAQEDRTYITNKYSAVSEKIPEIDKMIDERTENWDVTRMGKVELTVLRLAVYEMLYDEDIPETVAINEAVEIAKKFGQEASGSFINAILAKFVTKTKDE